MLGRCKVLLGILIFLVSCTDVFTPKLSKTEQLFITRLDKEFYAGDYDKVRYLAEKASTNYIDQSSSNLFKENVAKYKTMAICMNNSQKSCTAAFLNTFKQFPKFRLLEIEASHPRLRVSYQKIKKLYMKN